MDISRLASFLHSPEWEEFLRALGQTVARDGDALYVRGELPGNGSYWRGSRVTLGDSWRVPDFAKNAWFVRLEPNNEADLSRLGKVYGTNSVQPGQTSVMNLSQTEEELLAGMKQKHRYNIRVAEKHGVTVEWAHENAPEHFARFWKLLNETSARHDFRTHNKNHYKVMLETLAPQGKAHLAFARLGGEDIAAILLLSFGSVATYLHGGSTARHKEVMAPFLLQWTAMRWAKENGYTSYDFWGTNAVRENDEWVPRPASHPSHGTTRFKLGYGGTIVEYPHAVDLVLKPIPYTLYRGIRRIMRRESSF